MVSSNELRLCLVFDLPHNFLNLFTYCEGDEIVKEGSNGYTASRYIFTSTSLPLANSQIEQLLANISSRLERMQASIDKHSPPSNPLWYMPILAEVETQGWIISSEEVEQLIGVKPHCAPGDNSFMRGCWKFVKAGKVGTHFSWRVIKEIATVPSELLTSEPEGIDLQPDVSPWSENS